MTKTANASADGSQRKRNTNQSRPNVASQQNNSNSSSSNQQQKKGNKQTQQQNNAKASAPTPSSTSKPASPSIPQLEKHVPLKDFNGDEIDSLLSRGIDLDAEVYKPEMTATQQTAPWGQKPGTMATGKDFWLELRKQVATLQKGESTNKGG